MYLMLLLFSSTDTFIRMGPILMFISNINVLLFNFDLNIVSSIVSFVIFVIFFVCTFRFEFQTLNSGTIIKLNKKTFKISSYYVKTKDETLRHKNLINKIYSCGCVFSSALYLLVLIDVPHLKYKINKPELFLKYQEKRIILSICIFFVLLLLQIIEVICDLKPWTSYDTAMLVVFILVLILHIISSYYL